MIILGLEFLDDGFQYCFDNFLHQLFHFRFQFFHNLLCFNVINYLVAAKLTMSDFILKYVWNSNYHL